MPSGVWVLNYIAIRKLQWLHRWRLGMDKLFHLTFYNGWKYCGRRRVRLSASPPEYSCGAVGWVLDGWLRQSQRRGFESQRRLLRHLVSEVPALTANLLCCTIPAWNFGVDAHSRSRRAKILGQSGPRLRAKADQARGVRVKAGQDRGSRRATIGCQGGQRWRAKADRDHSEIKKGE